MINKVILLGNVGADPEIRSFENGIKVARVRLATTERVYNRQTQEAKEHTEWHTLVIWRNLADVVDKYVKKGSQIYVEGSLRTNEWTDKEGQKRRTIEVVVNDLKLLGGRPKNAAGGAPEHGGSVTTPYGAYGGQQGAPQQPQQGYQPAQPQQAPMPQMPAVEPIPMDDPDDLPF